MSDPIQMRTMGEIRHQFIRHLEDEREWTVPNEALIERLDECIQLCDEYIALENGRTQDREIDKTKPNEMHWFKFWWSDKHL